MATIPETRYARKGDVHVAYQVIGDGPLDLLYAPQGNLPIDLLWDEPALARSLRRLGSFSRLIISEVRGWGSSDAVPTASLPALQSWMDDLATVLDTVDSSKTTLFTTSEACLHTMLFAATHPDRVRSLVLWSPYARLMRDTDHPFGIPPETIPRLIETQRELWGSGALVDFLAPSRAGDTEYHRWWARCERLGAGPGTATAIYELYVRSDLRGVLPSIQAPTLVLRREGDPYIRAGHAAHVAAEIGESELVELPGDDHIWYAKDADAVVDRIESFLTGRRARVNPNRILSTVLFSDIAGSTERAANMGDTRWATLLAAHDDVTAGLVREFGGRVVKSTGDGMLATFDGPARAITCAVEMHGALASLELRVRIGLHTGEIETTADDVGGIAVHIASRIMDLAQPGQVLVSGAVPPLVLGSGLAFEELGTHELRGIPDRWPILSVVDSDRPA